MKPIYIGQNADNIPIHITPEMRRTTHMHVIGGSGTGKSKFLEWVIREDIREGRGFCLVDWHGTLYKDVLRYCAHLDVGLSRDFRKIILLNPSQPDYITGFNPFMSSGVDVSVQVRRRINATIRPWGITDTNTMPTFESVMFALYTFAVEQGETLPNAARLLEYERHDLRQYAAAVVEEYEGKRQLRRLLETKTLRDWRDFVMSAENRLGRFLGSKTVRRFMGLTEGNIDLLQAMDEGWIVLVNLGFSDYLDREAARVFASLMLNEFFENAMRRANDAPYGKPPTTFSLYLDEFQEYITDDIAAMLDQVRKGGLHMVLAHQHLGHLADNQHLLKSILANARIRAVFGGLPYDDACALANEMFLHDLNTRQIKKAYYHTIHLYNEQTRLVQSSAQGRSTSKSSNWSTSDATSESHGTSRSQSEQSGYGYGYGSSSSTGSSTGTSFGAPDVLGQYNGVEGWFTQSEGEYNATSDSSYEGFSDLTVKSNSESFTRAQSQSRTTGGAKGTSKSSSSGISCVPVWVPIPVEELGSEAEWSLEEKRSKVAEMLKYQQQQHCFIKLDNERTQPLRVSFVKPYSPFNDDVLKYEQAIYREQGAKPAPDVDRFLEDNATRFLNTAYATLPESVPEQQDTHQKTKQIPKKTIKQKDDVKDSAFAYIPDEDTDPFGRE